MGNPRQANGHTKPATSGTTEETTWLSITLSLTSHGAYVSVENDAGLEWSAVLEMLRLGRRAARSPKCLVRYHPENPQVHI